MFFCWKDFKEFFDFAGSTHEKNKWARSLEDDFAEEKEKEKKGKERKRKERKRKEKKRKERRKKETSRADIAAVSQLFAAL